MCPVLQSPSQPSPAKETALDTDLVDLESAIKNLPGVLGCVIMTDPDGNPSEIQAFIRVGVDEGEVHRQVLDQVNLRGLGENLSQIFVFELEGESHFGDRESLERAAELAEQEARTRGAVGAVEARRSVLRAVETGPRVAAVGRPLLQRVILSATGPNSEAEVALAHGEGEIVGHATGEKTPHGLAVLAQATLAAVAQIVTEVKFALTGASLIEIARKEAVMVVVQEDNGLETVGAALVRGAPLTECAVRATLDAVNRRLARASERFSLPPKEPVTVAEDEDVDWDGSE
ncbi:MAG TPA: hypothetical protein VHJ82_08710 [Actinomycetota bacterium]|nr:hypothetical protein [Actinomycetota bacterium]